MMACDVETRNFVQLQIINPHRVPKSRWECENNFEKQNNINKYI